MYVVCLRRIVCFNYSLLRWGFDGPNRRVATILVERWVFPFVDGLVKHL
jgi:hypothetical protein